MSLIGSQTVIRTVLSLFAAAAALPLLGGCMMQEARFTETRLLETDHVAQSAIDVRTANGSVVVERDDIDHVSITAKIAAVTQERLDAVEIVAERGSAQKLKVRANWPDGRRYGKERCAFEIRLPEAVGAQVRTSNGSVRLEGLGGDADVNTSNGSVVIFDQAGSVLADTSNGALRFERIGGDIRADTSNGRVTVVEAQGAVTLDTSNGSVTVELGHASTGPIDVKSSNGSVAVALPHKFSGELRMRTGNGRVTFDLEDNVTRVAQAKSQMTLVLGDGGPISTIRTSNGSIRLRRVE